MGLFIIDMATPPTVQSRLEAAIANIELFVEETRGYYQDEMGNSPLFYLLEDFAKSYIEKAIQLSKEV